MLQPVSKYCKDSGHLIDECRKLAYRRSVQGRYENNPSQQLPSNISGPKQNQNVQNLLTKSPGNAESVPAINGARPNAAVIGHMNQNQKSVQFQNIAEAPLLHE